MENIEFKNISFILSHPHEIPIDGHSERSPAIDKQLIKLAQKRFNFPDIGKYLKTQSQQPYNHERPGRQRTSCYARKRWITTAFNSSLGILPMKKSICASKAMLY